MWLIVNILTVLLYTGAALMQYRALNGTVRQARSSLFGFGFLAVTAHALMLYHWIDVGGGQNLSPLNLFSLVSWLVATLLMIFALSKPLENLSVFIFPLAAFSILLVMVLPTSHVVDTGRDPKQLVHILLSVLSFSVLVMAAVQALLVAIQQHRLRFKQGSGLWHKLPALETMEAMLFQLISLGFVLLTILLATSFTFYHALLWQGFWQKSLFACAAWLTFATLLTGRRIFGWHGKKAIYCTLGGIALLFLTYISSTVIIGSVT